MTSYNDHYSVLNFTGYINYSITVQTYTNTTDVKQPLILVRNIFLGLFLGVLCLLTIIGNAMVLHAVRTEKSLQTVSNMFIVSLAIADLIVGAVVMPMSAVYIYTEEWIFGIVVCQIWLGTDYIASTASILNLFILSLDRYWSVTSPLKYLRKRTKKRANIMITIVWCVSSLWLVPILGWHHIFNKSVRSLPENECDTEFATNIVLKILTGIINFYLPLTIMYVLYGRIFITIKRRSKLELGQQFFGSCSTKSNASDDKANINFGDEEDICEVFEGSDELSYTERQMMKMDKKTEETKLRSQWITPRENLKPTHFRNYKSNFSEYEMVTHEFEGENNHSSKVRCEQTFLHQCAHVNLNHHSFKVDECQLCNKKRNDYNKWQRNKECYKNIISTKDDFHACDNNDINKKKKSSKKQNYHENKAGRVHQSNLNNTRSKTKLKENISNNSSSKQLFYTANNIEKPIKTRHKRPSTALSREIKAAKQLGVIMGAFTLCFFPYFVIFMVVAFCHKCVGIGVIVTATWIGYLNSSLNPILYPLCNVNFRIKLRSMLNIKNTVQTTGSIRIYRNKNNCTNKV